MVYRFILLLTIAVVAGCDSTPTEPDRSTLPIMPLAVGNEWIGKTYGFDTLGRPANITFDTMRIVSSRVIDGETWFENNYGALYINRADGLWVRSDAAAWEMHLAKHPAEVGQVFGRDTLRVLYTDTLQHDLDTVVLTRLVIAVGTQLSIDAGSYLVNGYQTVLETIEGRVLTEADELFTTDKEYYAPNVGLVQQLFYSRRRSYRELVQIWELVEARVK